MKAIYKYPILGKFAAIKRNIEFSAGARLLSAGRDPHKNMCIWATFDSEREKVERTIYCIGTGWDIEEVLPADTTFLDTVVDGACVWHIFYGPEKKIEKEEPVFKNPITLGEFYKMKEEKNV